MILATSLCIRRPSKCETHLRKKHEKSREKMIYHVLTIKKVKIITLLCSYLLFSYYYFTQKSLTSHRVAYGKSYRNLLIVVVNKDVFIFVNYWEHLKQLTRSLLQQMDISIITVLLLPQQTTSVSSPHTCIFSLLFLP